MKTVIFGSKWKQCIWIENNNKNVKSKNQIVKPKTPVPVKGNNRFDSLTVKGGCIIDTPKRTA